MLSGLYFYKSGDWGQYTLFHNVSSRTLNLLRKFRRAAELKVLVLVLWHAASNEGTPLETLVTATRVPNLRSKFNGWPA